MTTRTTDRGFSLTEVLAALAIAGVVLTALLGATISAARASVSARVNQQSADLLTRSIEEVRAYEFGSISMATASLATDPTILGTTPNFTWVVPNGIGSEAIVHHPSGAINPHITTVTANTNNTQFQLARYVTLVPGTETKRITAIVSWNDRGKSNQRVASTLVTNTRTGLQLPDYSFQYPGGGTTAVNPGSRFIVPLMIKNLGARDSFTIQAKELVSGTPMNDSGWLYYTDPDCTGGWNPMPELGADDPNPQIMAVNGLVNVGDIYPDSLSCFIAAHTTNVGDPNSNVTTYFEASSVRQPSAATAVQRTDNLQLVVTGGVISNPTSTPTSTSSPTATPTVPVIPTVQQCATPVSQPTPPATFSLHRFTLLNGGTTGNTATIPTNEMARNDCTVHELDYNYSDPNTSISPIGRLIQSGGVTSGSGGARVAEWHWLAPVITEIQGQATVQLTYACSSGSSNVSVAIGSWNQTKNVGQWSSRAEASRTLACTGGWATTEFTFSNIANFILKSGNGSKAVPIELALRVVVTSGSDLRINYDSQSAPSTLFIGTKP